VGYVGHVAGKTRHDYIVDNVYKLQKSAKPNISHMLISISRISERKKIGQA